MSRATHIFKDKIGNSISVGDMVAVVILEGWKPKLRYGEVLSVDSKIKIKGFGAKRTCKEVLVLKEPQ